MFSWTALSEDAICHILLGIKEHKLFEIQSGVVERETKRERRLFSCFYYAEPSLQASNTPFINREEESPCASGEEIEQWYSPDVESWRNNLYRKPSDTKLMGLDQLFQFQTTLKHLGGNQCQANWVCTMEMCSLIQRAALNPPPKVCNTVHHTG